MSGGAANADVEKLADVSALELLVPEAEALVGPFRQRYDPVVPLGMPAHVTVLFPFLPPERIGVPELRGLREHFAGQSAFDFALSELREFPGTLYLAPEPDEPFVALLEATASRYPETPPYGGAFDEIVPHLTVAHAEDPAELAEIRRRVEDDLAAHGPIRAKARAVRLMIEDGVLWRKWDLFPLARP